MAQLPLIPISQQELNESSYRIAQLLQEKDDAEENFREIKKSHKEHMGAINQEIIEHRATIRRAQLEAEEGLMGVQIQAALDHLTERAEEDTQS